ncbi:MAG: hypothetical protein AB7O30_10760 [Dehalococcoidia bacterium]
MARLAEYLQVLLVVYAIERAVQTERGRDVIHLYRRRLGPPRSALPRREDPATLAAGEPQRVLVQAIALVAAVRVAAAWDFEHLRAL